MWLLANKRAAGMHALRTQWHQWQPTSFGIPRDVKINTFLLVEVKVQLLIITKGYIFVDNISEMRQSQKCQEFCWWIKCITNLPVGAIAASMPVRWMSGSRTTGVTWAYVSVTLGGTGRGKRVSIPPPMISSPPGGGVRPGTTPGAGVMRMMSGKGVVLMGTAPSSSPAEETGLHNCLIKLMFIGFAMSYFIL